MRFKKLKISVGISLIIFAFVVGNIIFIGELMKNKSTVKYLPNQKVIAITDKKKIISPNITVDTIIAIKDETQKNMTAKKATSKTATSNNDTYQITKPVVKRVIPPEQIIVHTKRRTRAS